MPDPPHALAAARYIELNPVRARLAAAPADWSWSGARAHLDGLVTAAALGEEVGGWRAFRARGLPERDAEDLRRHGRPACPLGDAGFLAGLERRLGRRLRPGKSGRRKARTGSTDVE